MFAKIFEQIFDSSIAEDYQVRHCFEDLLKLADADGAVDMTLDAIQRRTNMPLDLWKRAIVALESPDPQSRSKEHEGRRLIRIDSHRDWGWIIVNYRHYRELRDEEARKSYFRDYQRRRRGSKLVNQESPNVKYSHQMSPDITKCSSVSTQEEGEAEEEAEVPSLRSGTETERASVGRPSLQEVLAKAQFIGLAAWKAEDWFNEMEGCGWLDHSHRPVGRWESVLSRVRTKWQADGCPTGPPKSKAYAPGAVNGTADRIFQTKALERLEERLKFIRGQEPPAGSPLAVEREGLRVERKRLMLALGLKA